MLETFVSFANFIKTSFYYVLYWSYKTGFLIVSFVNLTIQYLATVTENALTFFNVLYESWIIFLQDNLQFLQQALAFIVSTMEVAYLSIITIFYKISNLGMVFISFILSTCTIIATAICSITAGMMEIIFFTRTLIIIFGSGVWFLITLAPLLLYYSCTMLVSIINKLGNKLCDISYNGVSSCVNTFIKGIITFVLDVPIESIAGILITLSLSYIFGQFYNLIMLYIKQKLRTMKNWYQTQQVDFIAMITFANFQATARQEQANQNHMLTSIRPVRTIQQTQDSLTSSTKSKKQTSTLNEEKCCVICQERNKCVLLLPCRHLCLCTECTQELRYYNELCPICRTNIDSTMKIYV